MATSRTLRLSITVLLLLGIQSNAQQVGDIVDHDRIVSIEEKEVAERRTCPDRPLPPESRTEDSPVEPPERRVSPAVSLDDSGCPMLQPKSPVKAGSTLRTESTGRIKVFLLDEDFPESRRQFEMLGDTSVTILDSEALLSLSPSGKVRWLGADRVQETQAGGEPLKPTRKLETESVLIDTDKTEFIVEHKDKLTTIIAVTDGVQVQGHKNGKPLDDKPLKLDAGGKATVEAGFAPEFVRTLVEEELREQLSPFHFIGGGRAQSLARNSAFLDGQSVPEPDRAPLPPPHLKDEDRLWPEQPILVDLFVR